MGKRVDHCARSVIGPGPDLDLDQVGVPKRIALRVTVPEVVTEINRQKMMKRVQLGSGRLDGAETVITDTGTVIQLAHCKNRVNIVLRTGWTVERPLNDGDVVAFNRQPSLHKMGIMGHTVVIIDGNVIRMNLSVTSPYNADFDGDEMNLHVM